jgi:phage FluMu protein Com
MPLKAPARRSSDVLQVKCPHCHEVNSFPDWDSMDIFICDSCGEPVEVEEPVQ